VREENITTVNWEDIDKLKGQTDWERIRNLTDEEIEQAVTDDPEAPPILGNDFFEEAEIVTYQNGKREVVEEKRNKNEKI
jgi:superoxide dismutase